MTYEEILKALPEQYRNTFEREVETEAAALLAMRLADPPRKPRRATGVDTATARADAEKFYAGDVTEYLTGKALDPKHVFVNRRAAHAWAIAQLLPEFWRTQARARGYCNTHEQYVGAQCNTSCNVNLPLTPVKRS